MASALTGTVTFSSVPDGDAFPPTNLTVEINVRWLGNAPAAPIQVADGYEELLIYVANQASADTGAPTAAATLLEVMYLSSDWSVGQTATLPALATTQTYVAVDIDGGLGSKTWLNLRDGIVPAYINMVRTGDGGGGGTGPISSRP